VAGRRPDPPSSKPGWLPRQRRGVSPQMIGRYPDYDVLEASGTWDEPTRRVVMARLDPPGPLRFVPVALEPAFRAFCDRVTAQDADPRVPVAEMVDARLAEGRLDGYRYEDLPDDRETWRRVVAGLDEAARAAGAGEGFARAQEELQHRLIGDLEEGRLEAPALEGMNGSRAWSVCMRMVLGAFYSHPWAWNEIGFGGPAYPRGFMRTRAGTREPFERPGATGEDPVPVAERLGP
jgi:hypothetical protein